MHASNWGSKGQRPWPGVPGARSPLAARRAGEQSLSAAAQTNCANLHKQRELGQRPHASRLATLCKQQIIDLLH
jgi:hypothetical protein